MNGLKKLFVTALLAVMLTDCGGGGGGGDGGGAALALDPLLIEQENAMQVAAVVLDAVAFIQGLDAGFVEPPAQAAAVADEAVAVPSTLTEIVRDQVDRFELLQGPAAKFQIAAIQIPPTTLQCLPGVPENGTITISGTIADATVTFLTPGDTLIATFNNCDEGDGVVVNGKMVLVVVTGVDFEFTPPYDFTFDATMTNFSMTESGERFTVNGDLTLREAVSADGLFIESEASGNKLTVTYAGETERLRDYWLMGTLDLGAGDAYTADSAGLEGCCAILESTLLGGIVEFENILAFAGVGENYPYEGILFVTGAMGESGIGFSTLELLVLDETCVDLSVDGDGDGGVDVVIRTTWESLPTGVPADCAG
jgi:hypothetical protein